MSNKKKKREYLSMSDQHLADQEEMWELIEELMEKRRAKNLGYTIETKNQGGMMDINRMTAPLGYDNGGDVDLAKIMADMKASRGPAEVTHPIQKIISDRTLIDPYSVSQKERAKELGSKGLEGIRSLIGAKEAGASEILDPFSDLTDNQLWTNYAAEMQFHILGGGEPDILPDDLRLMRDSLVRRGVLD